MEQTILNGEVQVKEEYTQYIVIRLGAENFGIDIMHVDNIVRMQRVTRVPKVPAYIRGVINLRGEVIPVISLRVKFGLEPDVEQKSTRIIILKTEQDGNVGVMVDEVKEVVTLGESQVDKVAPDARESKIGHVIGVGKYQNELVSILDMACISLEEQEA